MTSPAPPRTLATPWSRGLRGRCGNRRGRRRGRLPGRLRGRRREERQCR